jgi:hypothetical protein
VSSRPAMGVANLFTTSLQRIYVVFVLSHSKHALNGPFHVEAGDLARPK